MSTHLIKTTSKISLILRWSEVAHTYLDVIKRNRPGTYYLETLLSLRAKPLVFFIQSLAIRTKFNLYQS